MVVLFKNETQSSTSDNLFRLKQTSGDTLQKLGGTS